MEIVYLCCMTLHLLSFLRFKIIEVRELVLSTKKQLFGEISEY